jgi:hypothetical protein
MRACASLARRRSTEDGMRKLSRYFATVRRAISMSLAFSRSTIASSDGMPSTFPIDHL